tara:strand:+ start:314703 stop:314894 length:192 start_codon:yes stop_codon:yes gene_type:complete
MYLAREEIMAQETIGEGGSIDANGNFVPAKGGSPIVPFVIDIVVFVGIVWALLSGISWIVNAL